MTAESQPTPHAAKTRGEHGAGFVLPGDQEVDCACDRRLHRPVLRDPTGWNIRITACMKCGTLTLAEAMVEEPQPHDVRCVGNRILAMTAEVAAWVGAWPRLAWSVYQEDRQVYLPAS